MNILSKTRDKTWTVVKCVCRSRQTVMRFCHLLLFVLFSTLCLLVLYCNLLATEAKYPQHKYMTFCTPKHAYMTFCTPKHTYMTVLFPGLVQAKKNQTHIHDRSVSWLGTGKIPPNTHTWPLFPGLVQAKYPQTHIHDRSVSWLGTGKIPPNTHTWPFWFLAWYRLKKKSGDHKKYN